MGTTYTRQSSYSDGDVITAAHTNDEFNQILAAFQAATGHTHDGTANEGGPITKLLGNTLTFGDGSTDADIVINFDANGNDGALTWKEDEDYFEFSDDILIASTEKLQFRDTAIYINSSTDGQLDLVADGAVLVDTAGDITLDADGGDIVLKDGGTQFASLTNTSGDLIIKSGSTTAMTFSGANVTFAGTVTIGSAGISEAELEILDGATVTTDELNILDGVTSTAAEINLVDGSSAGTIVNSKAVIYGSSGEVNATTLQIAGTSITSTAAELNILDGVTSTAAELNILDGVTSTAAELNILDGVTSTATELNIVDGNTSATSTTLADADRVVVNDNGTMVQVALTDFETYFESALDTLSNVTTVGALNSGSITSGFGAIDNGSSAITTTGTITYGSLSDGTITVTAFVDEDDMSSNSATLIPTQQSVKAYVDTQITAEDLDVTTDSGTIAIDLDSETLTFTGGTGIDTSATGNAVTFAIDSTVVTESSTDTLTNKTLTSPKINEDVAVTSTATELNILDGVTSTTGEINLLDGSNKSTSSITIADADAFIIIDGTTTKQIPASDIPTYIGTSLTSTGALDSGSITSGFGNIDNGTSNITSGGLLKIDTDADADDLTGDSSSGRLTIGAGEDLNLYHGGTNSYIVNDTGDLIIDTAGDVVLDAGGADVLLKDGGTQYAALTNSSGNLIIKSGSTTALTFSGANATLAGDLTISGDDLTMGTNTAGHLLIADGTNFNPVSITSLSEISTVANDDVFLAVDASGGGLKKIERSAIIAGVATGNEISNVADDTTPQLGGDLDVNGNAIISASNGNIAITPNGSGVVRIDGSNGIDMQSGAISIKNAGSESYVRFYCESSNAHYTQLQAAPHSAYSGNVTVVLPASADTLVGKATTDTLTNKTFGDNTSFGDNNITNVGDIALDSISADGTDINVAVSDNSATAFTIKQGSDNYLVIDTGNSGESVQIGTGVSGTAITLGHGTSEVTVSDNLTVTGDLTVNGATTTVDTTNTTIKDNLLELNSGASSNSNDVGIIIQRGSTGNDALFMWDESADKFALGTTTDNASSTGNLNMTTGTLVANIEGNVTGNVTGNTSGTAATVTGAAQSNITSLGTLTTLTVDNVIINGTTIGHTDDTDLITLADGIATVAGELSVTTLDIGGTNVTASAADINLIDGITNGTVIASKAIITDSNKDISGGRNITISGELDAATLDISGDADIDGTLEADAITVGGTALNTVIAGVTVTDATNSAHVLVTDNESTNEDNLITFVEGATSSTGNVGLEMDGNLTYNPSTGRLTATQLAGTLQTAAQANITSLGTLTTLTVDDITINGSTISDSGDLTIDAGGDLILDAAGNDFKFKDNGTEILRITNSSSDVIIRPVADAKDIIFQQRDGTEVARVEDNGTFNVVTDKLAINGTAVTSTAAELNILDGVTSTTAELNILDGVTSTATELNILDGVTSTTAELNILDGATVVVGEINALDLGSTAVGTAIASKAVILDSNKDYTGIRNFTITGELDAATLDISGDADIDGTLEADAITVNGTALNTVIAGVTVTNATTAAVATTVTISDNENTNEENAIIFTAGGDVDGGNIGLESDGDLTYNPSTGTLTATIFKGNVDAVDGDFDGTLEADAITVGGVALSEVISDTTGAMFSSNTETGITVTYQDSDNTIDVAIDAAQTTITSLLATDIKIGEDDQTKIDFETADEIHFYAANAEQVFVSDGVFGPQTDSDVDLGTTGERFKDAYIDSVTVTGDVAVGDDASVAGRATGNQETDNDGNFDLATANFFKCTPSGNFTLTLSNPAEGQSGTIMLINTGGHTVSAHASVAINADILTAISSAGTYMLTYYCSASSGNDTILVGATGALA